jgi:hypothetical protein
MERPSPFTPRRSGIEAWQELRARAGSPDTGVIGGIRSILKQAVKPTGSSEMAWSRFANFMATANDEELLELIDTFEWGLGEAGSNELEGDIVEKLVATGRAATADGARAVYRVLFVAVIKCLSRADLKRLERRDLLDQFAVAELSAPDAAILRRIEEHVLSLDQRVSIVEDAIEAQRQQINNLADVGRTAPTGDVFGELGVIETKLPANVDRSVARSEVVVQVHKLLLKTRWLALYGSVGSGKTELAKLVASFARPTCIVFVALRDRSAAESELELLRALQQRYPNPDTTRSQLIRGFVQSLNQDDLLVIDDLPPLIPGDGLSRLLVDLCRACRTGPARMVTTSHHRLPDGVTDQLQPRDCEVVPIPPFNDDEVRELFHAWGMPPSEMDDNAIALLSRATSGHPTLLAATARYLSARAWHLTQEQLSQLLHRDHGGGAVNEALLRLLATVEDPIDRQFLYRLCLILGPFSQDSALVVATAHVSLHRPRERLANLAGPWIQLQGEGQMSVSPLIRPLAATELPPTEQRAVNIALGDAIVRSHVKNVFEVAEAATYFNRAGTYDRAATLFILAFHAARKLPDEQLRFLLSISWPIEALPQQIGLGERLYLRSFQIQACERLKIPAAQLFAESDSLAAAANKNDEWAVLVFAVQTLRFRAELDFAAAIRTLHRVAEVFPRLTQPGARFAGLPQDLNATSLLWHVVAEIKSPEQLHLWLDPLEASPRAELEATFSVTDASYYGCQLVADTVWMNEHTKPEATRDWPAVANVLARMFRAGEQFGLEPVLAAAARSRIVVLADYLKNPSAAERVAEEALGQVRNPVSVLLVTESMGKQFVFSKEYRKAVEWLTRATKIDTKRMPHIRADAHIYLATAIAEAASDGGDVQTPLRLTEQAATIAREARRIVPLKRVAVAGELAVARWLAGDLPSSYEAFDDAITSLVACEDDTADWKSMFMMLAHAGGYLSHVAWDARGPLETSDGGEYESPYRMMFLTAYREDRAALFNDERVAMLPSLMCLFAEAVANDDRAAHWALYGIDDARSRRNMAGIASLGWQLVPHLLREQRFVDAVDVSRETATAGVALLLLRERGVLGSTAEFDAAAVVHEAGKERQQEVDRMSLNFGMIPLTFGLALLQTTDATSAREHAEHVITLCRNIALDAEDSAAWNRLVDVLNAGHVRPIPVEELNQLANDAGRANQHAAYVAGYLGMSILPNTALQTAAVAHAIVMPTVERILSTRSSLYRLSVLPFMVNYWRRAVEVQPFRFSAPRFVAEALTAGALQAPREVAKTTVRIVLQALGASLPPEASDARQWLAVTTHA